MPAEAFGGWSAQRRFPAGMTNEEQRGKATPQVTRWGRVAWGTHDLRVYQV